MNSSLLLSLAITGGLVLAAIVAYNAWMAQRNAGNRPKPLALRRWHLFYGERTGTWV